MDEKDIVTDESGKKIEKTRYNNLGVLIKTKKY